LRIFFICTISCTAAYLGDDCALQSGGNGQCALISQCPSAIQKLQQGVRPQHCGFQGSEPIVCCPKHTEDNTFNSNSTKSKTKCEEYMERAKIPDPPSIVNGLSAEAGEFPHMVALGFGEENDKQWLCGGSLISEKFVLTAAHCVNAPSAGSVNWARMGTINLKEPIKGGYPQDFEIINRNTHPDYKPPSTYNDIALLELNDNIKFTQYVHPACINTESNTVQKFGAIGWGRLQFLGSTSNNLMKVDLEKYSNEVCNKKFSNLSNRTLAKGIDDQTQICAGGALNEPKDTCQGDSGGPLHVVLLDTGFTKVYNIIGVTSFGKGCGIANIPGVYTRVSHFVPWIESIVWP